MNFDWVAEQRISKAVRDGQLDNLPGAGKPLPPDILDPLVPSHLRAGLRVLANSNCPPLEVLQRCELADIKMQLAQLPDESAAPTKGKIREIARLKYRMLQLSEALERR